MEGRDIGSVVWPEAPLKLYLTADPAARALRRAAEEGGSDLTATEASLLARDQIDSTRATAPLTMADGAVHLDTTAYTLDEVIDQVVALVGAVEETRVTVSHSRHEDLPRSHRVRHPRRLMLSALRPVARLVIRRRVGVRVHGREQVPARGPVIFAANHIGVADGPILAIFAPRPVHALTKIEMFDSKLSWVLRGSGQIPLDRFNSDPAAVKTCLRVLRDGGAVGIFPEGRRGGGDLDRFHRGAALLRPRVRRTGRARDLPRHAVSPAATPSRCRPAEAWSTWCSARRTPWRRRRGRGRGNKSSMPRRCSGSTC